MKDFGTGLRRFSDMDDVQVAEDDPDVRGWDVVTPDGRDIGEVKDLLVDTDAMKVRALEVELDNDAFHLSDNRHVALPVDAVALDDNKDDVIVNRIGFDEIGSLPAYGANYDTSSKIRGKSLRTEEGSGREGLLDETGRKRGPKGDY